MEHGEDLHRSDTIEEKLSLVNRFGLTIFYAKPNTCRFLRHGRSKLARRAGITEEEISDEEICHEANKFRDARRRPVRTDGAAVCECFRREIGRLVWRLYSP